MTQQEYEQKEQKKLECYRELKEQDSSGLLSIATFEFIFDRAYALGKEKESITQDEIEKASVEYADKTAKQYEVCNSEFVQEIMVAFERGANFTLGKQEKDADTVIQGWVAKDADGDVFLYQNEPDRNEIAWNGYMMHSLPIDSFPDLTWSDEPQEVEIIIKRKKNE